jgi:TfoX/Sxy family transcriptional regulator of competence genes
MQTWDYERASIQQREDAKAVQCAAIQARADLHAEVTEAKLYSRVDPLTNEHLRIQGPRWYVTIHAGNQALYRVWREQGELKAAQVKTVI